MDENLLEKNSEVEIDVQRLLSALMKKAWLISIVAIVCAVLTLLGTVLFVAPKYESSILFYVNNSGQSGDASGSLSSSDISASKSLVQSYIAILNTRETMMQVTEHAGIDRTFGELRSMVSAEAVNSTEIIQITVTSTDANEAEELANAIAYVLPKRIDSIIVGTSAKIVDTAVAATSPSSPSYIKSTILGFLVGFVVVCLVIVMQELFDTTIRTEDDVMRYGQHTVLATVPDMEAPSKGGYYYGYRKHAHRDVAKNTGNKVVLVGDGISFAASEAYKLLRTKLQFSFADDATCRIIGVSSAMAGEGKSLTAVNLSYSMSQLGKRVLLIDCDMRRPSVAEKLPVDGTPGLSDFLSGQVGGETLIQFCGIKDDKNAFHVIPAGNIPPNPMELLSSNKMERTLNMLRANYDYIILDLPPVGEVGDALTVAKIADGLLLVVRQNYCNRVALSAAVRQFAFVNSKILGIVYNSVSESTKGYYRKYRSYGAYEQKAKQPGILDKLAHTETE